MRSASTAIRVSYQKVKMTKSFFLLLNLICYQKFVGRKLGQRHNTCQLTRQLLQLATGSNSRPILMK